MGILSPGADHRVLSGIPDKRLSLPPVLAGYFSKTMPWRSDRRLRRRCVHDRRDRCPDAAGDQGQDSGRLRVRGKEDACPGGSAMLHNDETQKHTLIEE